jgi:hypothetical protein
MQTETTDDNRAEMRELSIESSVRRLLEDVKALVGATAVLEGTGSPAKAHYESEVVRILSQMEIDLNIARSAFDAREATTSEGLHDTVRGGVDAGVRCSSRRHPCCSGVSTRLPCLTGAGSGRRAGPTTTEPAELAIREGKSGSTRTNHVDVVAEHGGADPSGGHPETDHRAQAHPRED